MMKAGVVPMRWKRRLRPPGDPLPITPSGRFRNRPVRPLRPLSVVVRVDLVGRAVAVTAVLDRAIARRQKPTAIQMDNGTAFTCNHFELCGASSRTREPAKPPGGRIDHGAEQARVAKRARSTLERDGSQISATCRAAVRIPHATVPKLLRPYFLHRRALPGQPRRATLRESDAR